MDLPRTDKMVRPRNMDLTSPSVKALCLCVSVVNQSRARPRRGDLVKHTLTNHRDTEAQSMHREEL